MDLELQSDATFSHLNQWLHTCQKRHRVCDKSAIPFMPSFAIDVGPFNSAEAHVRLVRSPRHERYVALSYCWGGDQDFKATTSNLSQLLREIDVSKLPKTIQDAITVTRRLGIRYLWVDSICIIQDDARHCGLQIAQMSKVYRNACVTILAARSASCVQGFLHNIQKPGASASAFRFWFRDANFNISSVIGFCEPDDTQVRNPLALRGWAMQEFLLSRRTIKFGIDHIRWTCRLSTWCLPSTFCDPYDDGLSIENWWNDRQIEELKLWQKFRSIDPEDITDLTTWTGLVENYTRRALSDKSDRLLALSGMATYIASRLSSLYVAGLWVEQLPETLLWQSTPPSHVAQRLQPSPSWSWATVDGPVSFQDTINMDPRIELVSANVVPALEEAPFGSVVSGELIIRGWAVKLACRGDGSLFEKFGSNEYAADADPIAYYSADISTELEADESVWCLQVAEYSLRVTDQPQGLVLTEHERNTFRRKGVFSYIPIKDDASLAEFTTCYEKRTTSWIQHRTFKEFVII
ncbi:heterokaryon incompatibility protein-domain-containing protein [Lophiotrema nucula]|uniref:Heterokaryon incompatibility protein-domain-containing protein n=1 Tax=Lophiotrema nucula TaxID=690887 RepID=A0A6A5YRZ9_9PLEO|nr:heterokaryon incompatibility protein-domain-containing protein [Lophiotrema nucula]